MFTRRQQFITYFMKISADSCVVTLMADLSEHCVMGKSLGVVNVDKNNVFYISMSTPI